MLKGFQLAAIVKRGKKTELFRVPLHQSLQGELADEWQRQLQSFIAGVDVISFNPGYSPENHEVFGLSAFAAPDWLKDENSISASSLREIGKSDEALEQVKGMVGFAQFDGHEAVMFQNFSKMHVIRPGNFLFLKGGAYEASNGHALVLERELRAVYFPSEKKLLFRNFRMTNAFLPLTEYYSEASEKDIKEVLGHSRLLAENSQQVVDESNQWTRKRFAMLRDSGTLDKYAPKEIQSLAKGYSLKVSIKGGKIVFPSNKHAVKRLLQFLNEELFKGPITQTLYETNSRRVTD